VPIGDARATLALFMLGEQHEARIPSKLDARAAAFIEESDDVAVEPMICCCSPRSTKRYSFFWKPRISFEYMADNSSAMPPQPSAAKLCATSAMW
jgi:hypothetical protein